MRHRFAGINVDFEQVSPGDRDQMTAFIGELAGTLKRAGLLVTQSVPPDDDAFDLRRLAELNDYLVAMVYDEHADADEPGPIASQAWVDRQLAALAATVPCDKTIIGLGNYGYEWTRGSGTAKTVGFAELMSTARRYDSAIEWDPVSKNAAFHYQRAGVWHDVWFLDAVTALNQARAAARAGFRWLALWRLGAEDPSVWSVISRERWPDGHADAQRLTSLPAQDIITSAADGEVLRITDMPRAGRRHVWRTDDDDAGERYESPPSSFIVERTGGSRRTVIALTLDDGPDPDYTPRVLDVLRRYRVPATFFVTGVNAEASPDLLRRIYREGHDIGNHTYSHPNIALVSRERARLELNATQRIIQHVLGVSTTLFRPPFNVDSEPRMLDELELIRRSQELGYVTVSARIDPQDWRHDVSAEEIVTATVRRYTDGHVVLLHDGAEIGLPLSRRFRGLSSCSVRRAIGSSRSAS